VVLNRVGPGGRVGGQQGVAAVGVPGQTHVLVQQGAARLGQGLVDLCKVKQAANLRGLGADVSSDAGAVLNLVEAGRLSDLEVARAVQKAAEREPRDEDDAEAAPELVHALLASEVKRLTSALVRELQHARVELDDGPWELNTNHEGQPTINFTDILYRYISLGRTHVVRHRQ